MLSSVKDCRSVPVALTEPVVTGAELSVIVLSIARLRLKTQVEVQEQIIWRKPSMLLEVSFH